MLVNPGTSDDSPVAARLPSAMNQISSRYAIATSHQLRANAWRILPLFAILYGDQLCTIMTQANRQRNQQNNEYATKNNG